MRLAPGLRPATLASAMAVVLAAPAAAQSSGAEAPNPAQTTDAGTIAPQGDQAEAQGIRDIIVTAQRREESLQEVPIAISAYDNSTLETLSTRQVGDIAAITPNLSRTSGPTGGNDAFFFIRGIGQVDSNPANDPGVGVYIDGVFLGRLQGASLDTQDIQRVEVLRGPQGTLFGRNTIGGAINITSLDPGDAYGAQGRLTLGSRNRIDAYVGVDLPVNDKLGVRVSALTRNQDGWGRNVYSGKTFGDIRNIAARVKAVWEPSADLRLAFTADTLEARGSTPQTILTGFRRNTGPIPAVGTTPLGVPFPPDLLADTSPNVDRSFASIDPKNNVDNTGASASLDWDMGGVNLRTILAYRRVEQFATNDFDATGYRLFDNEFDTQSNQYSAEIQLFGTGFDERLEWLLGVYGYREDIDHVNRICLGTNLGSPFPGPRGPQRNQGGCLQNNQAFNLEIDNYAAFAHTSFDLTDRLSVVVGGRYTYERKRQAFDFFLNNSGGVASLFGIPPLPNIPTLSPRNPAVGVPTTYRKSWKEFTPRLGLNYQANDDLLFYASYSRGFKSGGFNGRPNPGPRGFRPIEAFDPETLDAYELGFKSDLLGDRLRVNGAAFYSIYDGIQLLVLDPESGFFNNANAGRNRILGFELETTAKPTDELLLYANVGFLDDKYTRLDPRANLQPGSRLPVTPRWTIGAGASYQFDLGPDAGSITPRADYTYRSSVFYNAPNAPLEFQEGFGLLNLRVTWTDPDTRYSIAAFALNATDKRYFSNASDVRSGLGVAFAQIGAPREFGLELGARF